MVKILFADKNTSEMENISSEIFTIEEKSNYFDIKYFEDEDKIKYQYWNYNPDVFILDGVMVNLFTIITEYDTIDGKNLHQKHGQLK